MKVYRNAEFYMAVDGRGMAAPALTSNYELAAWFEDPETFLRLAYTLCWVPAGTLSQTLQGMEKQPPLWERPDPRLSMYDCGDMMIAVDQDGELAPLTRNDSISVVVWEDPLMFMRRNAEGNIAWTSDLSGSPEKQAQEKAELGAAIMSRGRKLWHVPVPAKGE